jgi:outer membrane lipoprotein LolB
VIPSVFQKAAPTWLVSAVLLLTGCATQPPVEPPSARISQLWQQHARAVAAQSDWALSGRIAASSEDDGWSGKLYWQQGREDYRISFNAPSGQGGLLLDGRPQQVEMLTSDGERHVASDAESLLLQTLGWELPLSSLRYWVRGIPVPASDDTPVLAFDDSGRLTRLRQSDWAVEYPAYRPVNGLMLPRKVFLENAEFSVRLVIDRWLAGESHMQ